MFKVIVADDEINVCRLIIKLIDWEALDMEIVGVAHNGIQAVEMAGVLDPDIIITDIRMPGYDGLDMIERAKEVKEDLQFIIISGYGQFEYAQRAIRFGVSDYLLKPIKKEELMKTLIRIKEAIRERRGELSASEQVEMKLRNDMVKLRSSLLYGLFIYDADSAEFKSAEAINEAYHFSFRPGNYQVFTIRMDCSHENYQADRSVIEDKVSEMVSLSMNGLCFDIETIFEENTCYCLMNYREEDRRTASRNMKSLLQELIQYNAIFKDIQFTIGVGKAVSEISRITDSFESAIWNLEERIVKGTGKIYDEPFKGASRIINSSLLYDFNTEFILAVDRLSKESLLLALEGLKNELSRRTDYSGHELIHITNEVCNLYVFTMRKNHQPIEDNHTFLEKVRCSTKRCISLDMLFDKLGEILGDSLDLVVEGHMRSVTRPIRIAKNYIEENYMMNLSLEEIGKIVGLTPTYLSTVFKKETGSSFIEYLSEVRISQAKSLLRNPDLRVSDICEMVGYSDVKYFTKSFIRHTGLKPNEYRKIYS